MERHIAIDQLMGQAHQIPVADPIHPDSTKDRITRRPRSKKVAAMNWPMAPTPRRMPSATSFADTTK